MKLLFMTLLLAGVAHAGAVPEAPGLLKPAVVLPMLEQDPEVMAARAGLEQARQEAKTLEASPYEWTARANAQRRTSDPGARSNEWNVGLERTVRLPAKASADRHIAASTLDEGTARYREAWRAASRELIDQWLDWLAAKESQSLATAHQQAALENLAVVEKRIKAGDASRLDASLARAELAEQQRVGNEARTASAVAWAKLHARFPALPELVTPVPPAVPLALNVLNRAGTVAQSPGAKRACACRQGARPHVRHLHRVGGAQPRTHHWRHAQHSAARHPTAYPCQLGASCCRNDAPGARAEKARTGRIHCRHDRDNGRGVCRVGNRQCWSVSHEKQCCVVAACV
jgi:hypothetical protein